MAFKLRSPYEIDNTPIYQQDMGDDVLGMATNKGSILINKNVSPAVLKKNKTISHEKVHLDQMNRGDLDYNDSHVFWKGKKYPRATMKEGSKKLPWEIQVNFKNFPESELLKLPLNLMDGPQDIFMSMIKQVYSIII
jgi:hypothetical protein